MRLFPALLLLVLAGCSSRPELPVLGFVPPFTLIAQDGKEFRSAEALHGRVWVADFIFTSCAGPCPLMTTKMGQVQKLTADIPEVRLVSFTIDPARDTPEAFTAYAKRYQADTRRWFFLTGAQDALHKLNRSAFMLGDVDGSLEHSTRFVLVDRKSRIRGYYLTSEPDAIKNLHRDIRRLVKEPA